MKGIAMKELEGSAHPKELDRRSIVRAQSTQGVAPALAISESCRAAKGAVPPKLLRIATSQMRRNLVRNLRQGSVNDFSEQAAELSKVLGVKNLPAELSIRWAELRDVLSEASMLREPSAALSVVRGNRGRNAGILSVIQAAGGTIDRRKILDALSGSVATELSDSHLSHALTQMENANLLEREKHGNSVVVKITVLGSEALRDQSVVQTPWMHSSPIGPGTSLRELANQYPSSVDVTSSVKRTTKQAA
jgi:DNA-binding transcriptional ArsR family regulator